VRTNIQQINIRDYTHTTHTQKPSANHGTSPVNEKEMCGCMCKMLWLQRRTLELILYSIGAIEDLK
jgi:hypothetical protein